MSTFHTFLYMDKKYENITFIAIIHLTADVAMEATSLPAPGSLSFKLYLCIYKCILIFLES